MSKSSKRKNKVPKITEEEYAQYLSSLKNRTEKMASEEIEKTTKITQNQQG
jgi:hypothetical protein